MFARWAVFTTPSRLETLNNLLENFGAPLHRVAQIQTRRSHFGTNF